MSQDTHLFSARRPRETLGSLNFNSSIPQPTSALKRNSSSSNIRDSHNQAPYTAGHGRSHSMSRMSLAPARPPQPSFQQSTMGNNEMGRSAHRASIAGFHGGRASLLPGAMTPRVQPTPLAQSINRRSSVYSRPSTNLHMPHQSFFNQGPLAAGAPQDKRSLRDRGVQNRLATEIEGYLAKNGFSMETHHPLTPNSLKNPTGKDFNFIFQWLYRRIDPAYQFQKSIDNEVPAILKQLRYPYANSITKSQLAAVGGNNWGQLLGMLHWLMQVAIMMRNYADDRYDYACADAGVDVSGDRIIFRFLSGAYQTWLACPPMDDDDDDEADRLIQPHVAAMAAEFERGNEQYAEELKVLQAENQALQKQIAELERSGPDLAKQEEHYSILKSDITKFKEYNDTYGEKVKRQEQRNLVIQREIDDWEKQLKEVLDEKSQLQQAVDRQGISILDIDRMNAERERLQSGLAAVKERLEDINAKIKEQETEASDKLLALESLVRQFNSLCYDVGLRDEQSELVLNIHDPGSSSNFSSSQYGKGEQLLDGENGYHPSRILNLDLKVAIKNQITAHRKDITQRRNKAKDNDEESRRSLFELSEEIDDKRHEVEALEHKVRSAEEEFEKTRDNTTTAKLNSDAQIEKMEKELAKMRADLTGSVQLMEQREINTTIEYDQLNHRANALREELHTEIERIINEVVKFKLHIQNSLEDYENFVVDEAGREGISFDDSMDEPKEEEK